MIDTQNAIFKMIENCLNQEDPRMPKARIRSLCVLVGCSISLVACGGKEDTSQNTSLSAGNSQASMMIASSFPGSGKSKFTLADGPDVCFRAAAKELGDTAKVSELTSFFSLGKDIDPMASAPSGEMTSCIVQYQSPQDPRKLQEVSMDVTTGSFGPPRPVEITVMGGDASEFRLEDHLIALSHVNAAGLKAIMDGQKASMDQVYGKYGWSGVRLQSPDAFDSKHTLRLDLDGRLASNDIKKGGYASISTDGKTIRRNFLKP